MMDEKRRLKHVERLTEINKLRTVAFCWLYSEKIRVKYYNLTSVIKTAICFGLMNHHQALKYEHF